MLQTIIVWKNWHWCEERRKK